MLSKKRNQNLYTRKILNEQTKQKVYTKALKNDFKKFGFTKQYLETKYETVDELKKSVPGLVLGEVVRRCFFNFDGSENKELIPREIYVMSLGTYMRIFFGKDFFYLKPYKIHFDKYFKRYDGQDLTNKKLLIMRTGGIGDIMFIQPIIKYLKEKYPSCYIGFTTSFENTKLFEVWPKDLIDEIHIIPVNLNEFNKYDYHLVFEGAIEKCKEATYTNCYDIFKKVAGLDFEVEKYIPNLSLDETQKNRFKNVVPENTILIQMRATSPIRIMGSKKWSEIVKKVLELGYNIGFIDSFKQYKLYDDFIRLNKLNKEKVFNLSKYSKTISDGVYILSNCKALLSIDSAFVHLAPALDIPTVGIYGPFLGNLRMGYYKNSAWVDSEDFEGCGKWPCFLHQHEVINCPYVARRKPVGCLDSISSDVVIEKLKNVLEEK